ncbi:hypothetical protein AB0J35_62770 [Nonomuraea angiospora]|uniref:hypothetical protein n=1 Tax=Nonomuraea angiospora TaxID=46172 RepID=UPI0034486F1F
MGDLGLVLLLGNMELQVGGALALLLEAFEGAVGAGDGPGDGGAELVGRGVARGDDAVLGQPLGQPAAVGREPGAGLRELLLALGQLGAGGLRGPVPPAEQLGPRLVQVAPVEERRRVLLLPRDEQPVAGRLQLPPGALGLPLGPLGAGPRLVQLPAARRSSPRRALGGGSSASGCGSRRGGCCRCG